MRQGEALILDCDGVLAETERTLHLPAFNQAFAELGVPVHWSDGDYAEKLQVGGGKERIATSLTPELAATHGLPSDPEGLRALIERVHARKGEIFDDLLARGTFHARPGVARTIDAAHAAGWQLAIASTASESSVRAVVACLFEPELAGALMIFAGDAVRAKKPDPAVYDLAVQQLGLSKHETIVIEDSRNGLLAATAAGLRCVVTVSDYTAGEDFSEAAVVLSDLGEPDAPMTVIANRVSVALGRFVTLADLAAIRAA